MSIFKALTMYEKPKKNFIGPQQRIVLSSPGAPQALGVGAPNRQLVTLNRSFALNINLDSDIEGFRKDDVAWETEYIKKQLMEFMPLILDLRLYNEDTSYKKRAVGETEYTPLRMAKLHWHGRIAFFKVYSREEYEDLFNKIASKFTTRQRSRHIALNYKKIKDKKHSRHRGLR